MLSGLIPFVIGFAGIVLFVIFRFVESSQSKRFFSGPRTNLDRMTTKVYRTLVLSDLPQGYRTRMKQGIQSMVHSILVFLASILRNIEQPLSRAGNRIRKNRTQHTDSDSGPSSYLKTITPSSEKSDGKDTSDPV